VSFEQRLNSQSLELESLEKHEIRMKKTDRLPAENFEAFVATGKKDVELSVCLVGLQMYSRRSIEQSDASEECENGVFCASFPRSILESPFEASDEWG